MNPDRSRGKHLRRFLLPAALFFLAALIWLLPAFHLSNIEVAGDLRSLSREDLVAASGLQTGRHLFSGVGGSLNQLIHLRYGGAESRLLEQFPILKSAEVQLRLPGSVVLSVSERVEVAYVAVPDGCVMIDKEGCALKILPVAPDGIPVIDGVSVTSMSLGQPLVVDVPAAMNSAIALMGAIIEADRDTRPAVRLLPQIRRIRPLSGRQLFLTIVIPDTGEEMTVAAETGQEQTEDMLWLRFALSQDALNGRGKGILDLTGSRRTFTPD